MPIGKSALKRVENSGYTKVKSEAPDMENSTVNLPTPTPVSTKTAKKTALRRSSEAVAEAKKTVLMKAEAKVSAKLTGAPATEKKSAEKKSTERSKTPSAQKTDIAKPKTKKSEAEKPEAFEGKDGFIKVGLGDEMPAYLL